MKEPVPTKLEPETIEEIDAYAERHDIHSRSEAVRQLLNRGLRTDDRRRANVRTFIFALAFGGAAGLANMSTGLVRFEWHPLAPHALAAVLLSYFGFFVYGYLRA